MESSARATEANPRVCPAASRLCRMEGSCASRIEAPWDRGQHFAGTRLAKLVHCPRHRPEDGAAHGPRWAFCVIALSGEKAPRAAGLFLPCYDDHSCWAPDVSRPAQNRPL